MTMDAGEQTETEERAKAIYARQTIAWTGNAWDWDKASEEVKERLRAHARAGTNPPLPTEI